MKNLRKVLAVVLVVAMAFSFAAVASAKFSDDSSIKYTTAVGVMTGIGAIKGYPDGTFGPTKTVTRAEAATMIAYVTAGPAIFNALPVTGAVFTDVPTTHWAAKYIEYCYGKGIIGGYGDGKFGPSDPVTGSQLAVMLLKAVGYGKNSEYGGASWEVNVLQDAFANNIFAGNAAAASYSVPATREEAALYIFNAMMNIDKVTYSKTNDAYTAVTTTNKTMAAINFGLAATPVTGIITGNAATGVKGSNVAVATLTLGKITALAAPATYKFDSTLGQIGTVVNIYAKDVNTVYYTATVSTSVKVATAISTGAAYTTAFGTATEGTATVNATPNYAAVTVDAIIGAAAGTFVAASTAPVGTYNVYAGQVVSYVEDSVSTIQKVTAIGTTAGAETITFTSTAALANNATSDVVNEYAGIAVGDYVQITVAGSITNAVKLTTVQGTVSEVGAANAYVVLGGSKYLASALSNVSGLGFATLATADYGKTTYTLYLDSANKAVGMTAPAAAATSAVVYVVNSTPFDKIGDYGTTKNYQCVDNSGKEVIYSTGATGDADVTAAGFYKVAVTLGVANFSAYTAADLAVATTDATVSKTDFVNGTNYYYAPDVQFIFISGAGSTLKIEKVTGLAAADGNSLTNAVLFFNSTTNVNKTVSTVMVPSAFANPTAVGTSVVYVPTGTVAVGANANGYIYNVYVDGVKTAITSSDADLTNVGGAVNVTGNFASYTLSTTGVYDFTAINAAANLGLNKSVATNAIFSSYITTGDPATIYAAGATVVDLVTASTLPAVYNSVAALEALTNTNAFTLSYVKNTSGVITTIYVTATTAYSPATVTGNTAKGLTSVVTVSQVGTTATYTVKISGTAAGAATVTIANGAWANPIPVQAGVVRTSGTVLTIADTTVLSNYTVTFTVTLTGVGAPVPTCVIA